MNDNAQTMANPALSMGMIAFLLLLALTAYIFFCFCLKKICEKCGVTPGILIWIPIANLIPLLQVAQMPVWMIILFFIPIVSLVVSIILWVKICQARGKSGWMALVVLLLPIVGLPYLAFSE